ncbi:MAG: pyruvate kinase [Gammaproteobacteria bacterium]|nr:pyruvate kinase [Gammaproteobacteria bacterium]
MINKSNKTAPRKTRIIATLGPATSDLETISKLLLAGVNIIRLNMSHGSHEHHKKSFKLVKRAAKKLKIQVGIFCDLCGPKIRVGLLKNGEMQLKSRSIVTITTRQLTGENNVIPCQYRSLHKDVKAGDRILLDDGKMELKVIEVVKRDIQCRVIYSGLLKDKKGINLPDTQVSSSSLTVNDKKDVLFAQQIGADFVALSFVRGAADVIKLKRFMKQHGDVLPVISKIEKPEALENFDEILQESYAIMVARGDLGIEIDAAQVPMVQKDLINRSRIACRPVIVATHMMESMITSSRPTRAEVGDVSNAALNGADAVMLSGETSVGRYPVRAVKHMDHILTEMEQWKRNNPEPDNIIDMRVTSSPKRALTHAVVGIAKDLDLLGLFVPTSSGATAGVVAAFRPSAPIIGICLEEKTARILMLHWGVMPLVLPEQHTQDWNTMSRLIARKFNFKLAKRSVVVLSGFGRYPDNYHPVLKILNY